MANLPDISDLLEKIRQSEEKEKEFKKLMEEGVQARIEAREEVVKRYKKAEVPPEQCDHPAGSYFDGNTNRCIYCYRDWEGIGGKE